MAQNNLVVRVEYSGSAVDLDVDSGIPLRVDISAVQNTDIGSNFGVGSQTFVLPGTRKNNQFFKNAYRVGVEEVPGFLNSLSASVIYNGESLLEGTLTLDEIIADDYGYTSYNVTVEDQFIGFKESLEGKYIKDANFDAYNHQLDSASVVNSWKTGSNAFLSGAIFYPLCDYGNDNVIPYPQLPRIQVAGFGEVYSGSFSGSVAPTGSIDSILSPLSLRQFIPAIRTKDLLDVIFNQAGYTYTSSFFETEDFLNTYVLSKSSEQLGPTLSGSIGANTLETELSTTFDTSSIVAGGQLEFKIPIDNEISDPGNNYNNATYEYTAPAAGNYVVDARCSVRNTSQGSDPYIEDGLIIEYLLKKNGTEEVGYQYTYLFDNDPNTASFQIGTSVNLELGDTLSTHLNYFNQTAQATYSPNRVYSAEFNIDSAPDSYNGAEISMSLQFEPQTKTLDLMKGIFTQFNLIAVPEPGQNKVLRIEPFDIWLSQGRTIDWTDKFDSSKRVSIKHPINEQVKELRIGNTDDNDRFSKISKDNFDNLQYGTIQLFSDSNIPVGKKEVKSLFGPVILGPIIQSGSVDDTGPTFNLSNTNFVVPHLYKFENREQQSFTFKPRLGYKVTNLIPIGAFNNRIYIQSGIQLAVSSSIYATLSNLSDLPATGSSTSQSLDLLFNNQFPDFMPSALNPDAGATAYETYWKNYIDGLYWNGGRKLTCDLKFTPEEYKDIRLNDRIFIKDFEYRINKISGFNLSEPDVVNVELISQFRKQGFAEPSPSPSPSAPLPTATATPSKTPTRSVTPSITPTVTPSLSFIPDTTVSPTPSITPTISTSPIGGVSSTPTPSVTPTISVTPTGTPSISVTPSISTSPPAVTCNVYDLYAGPGTGVGSITEFSYVCCNGTTGSIFLEDNDVVQFCLQEDPVVTFGLGEWKKGLGCFVGCKI